MTRQVLNRGIIANDGTGDTLRSASLKIEQNFQELYTKLGDGTTLATGVDFDSDGIVFEGISEDAHETKLYAIDPTADRRVAIPDFTGELLMDSAVQTMSNKTVLAPTITLPKFNDTSSNHTYNLAVNELVANRTITLPLLGGNDEFTFNSHTQTLSNKTITSPRLDYPAIVGDVVDSSGNELVTMVAKVNAVNHIKITNNVTGGNPLITAVGDDTNVTLELEGTNNGGVRIGSKLILGVQGINNNAAVSPNEPITIFDGSVVMTNNLTSGTTDGEVKWLINEGTATALINQVSGNLIQYSSITLPTQASVQLVWLSTSTKWMVITNTGATLNT